MKNKLSACSTISFIIPIESRSSDLTGGLRLREIIIRVRCPQNLLPPA
jgi:hypothetical protein